MDAKVQESIEAVSAASADAAAVAAGTATAMPNAPPKKYIFAV